MAKKRPHPATRRTAAASHDEPVPVVGAREPCPCGSGRRYKACHGRATTSATGDFVPRPFHGLPGECDWVALRELVPAGTAELKLAEGLPEGVPSVTLASLLPMAWPALRRENGEVLLGLQNDTLSGDISRDLANALLRALQTPPGGPVTALRPEPEGPRLQDLLDLSAPFVPVVHAGFDFWLGGEETAARASGEVAASLERANAAVVPTARLESVEAAYWCAAPGRNHLRWVMPHPEERLLDVLARLHAAGASSLGEGTRLVGSFRAHGLLVPVWDLPGSVQPDDVEKAAAAFGERLGDALASPAPLTIEERRSRNGLANRQVTLN